ncbi:hypothetical protein H0X48_02040 [Candidatus Dependentiae bacterium]|nr:hypothetical protein [Candidatus Dependentiae bacterium]
MKFLKLAALSLLTISCVSTQAFQLFASKEDKAFVKAVRQGNVETFERLYTTVSQKACDKAIKIAARHRNMDLFYKIKPRASQKGFASAVRSLERRGLAHTHNHTMAIFTR